MKCFFSPLIAIKYLQVGNHALDKKHVDSVHFCTKIKAQFIENNKALSGRSLLVIERQEEINLAEYLGHPLRNSIV